MQAQQHTKRHTEHSHLFEPSTSPARHTQLQTALMAWPESSTVTTTESWAGVKLEDVVVSPRPEHLSALAQRKLATPSLFLDMFRGAAPYIRMHRGTTMVIHVPGESLEDDLFNLTMDEIALVSMLGARIVLVVGCRPQIDQMLKARGLPGQVPGEPRVTDDATLRVVKQCAGMEMLQTSL